MDIYAYSSTQINLPDDLSDKIIAWGEKYVPNEDLYVNPNDPTYGRETEPHVTVLYGLHTGDATEVKKLLIKQTSFNCQLASMSLFMTNDKYDVLKINVKCSELGNLHKMLTKLDYTSDFASYKPHVTIAYLKKNKGDRFIGKRTFNGVIFPVHELIFSSRTGKRVVIPFK